MLIAIAKIRVRSGHIDKILPLMQENTEIGTSKEGHLKSYLAKNTENENELLVYSLWSDESLYEQARKDIKKDSRTRKAMFHMLRHLAEDPVIETFTVIP